MPLISVFYGDIKSGSFSAFASKVAVGSCSSLQSDSRRIPMRSLSTDIKPARRRTRLLTRFLLIRAGQRYSDRAHSVLPGGEGYTFLFTFGVDFRGAAERWFDNLGTGNAKVGCPMLPTYLRFSCRF